MVITPKELDVLTKENPSASALRQRSGGSTILIPLVRLSAHAQAPCPGLVYLRKIWHTGILMAPPSHTQKSIGVAENRLCAGERWQWFLPQGLLYLGCHVLLSAHTYHIASPVHVSPCATWASEQKIQRAQKAKKKPVHFISVIFPDSSPPLLECVSHESPLVRAELITHPHLWLLSCLAFTMPENKFFVPVIHPPALMMRCCCCCCCETMPGMWIVN